MEIIYKLFIFFIVVIGGSGFVIFVYYSEGVKIGFGLLIFKIGI